MFKIEMNIEDIVTADIIYRTFRCQRYKGIMASSVYKALVIVTDVKQHSYIDKWDNDIIYYTGAGEGNQCFDALFRNNDKLRNSKKDGTTVYLFEKIDVNQYLYRGIVELCKEPYMSNQIDKSGKNREVCIFPLKLNEYNGVDATYFNMVQNNLQKKVGKKSDEELLKNIINVGN